MSDVIKHECGVALLKLKKPLEFYKEKYGFATYGLNRMALLMEKQVNRGQDGAGIANIKFDVEPGRRYISRKRSVENQSVAKIFSEINNYFDKNQYTAEQLEDPTWLKKNLPFTGELYLGHLRYGTFGKNSIESCHPFLRQNNWMSRNLVVAGNFNLTNVDELFDQLIQLGQHPKEYADTVTVMEKIGHFLDEENEKLFSKYKNDGLSNPEISRKIGLNVDIEKILKKSSVNWDGGYTMAGLIGHGDSFVLRDPNGIRPCFYYEDDEIVTVASERSVIQTVFNVATDKVRELGPGNALIIKKHGDSVEKNILEPREKLACTFERIYFGRSNDAGIYSERKQLGKLLSKRIMADHGHNLNNMVFTYIPNTAETAYYGLLKGLERRLEAKKIEAVKALGNQEYDDALEQLLETRIRIEKLILKDAKMRTFISNDSSRKDVVSGAYDITYGTVKDGTDTIVALDDSIVRGTTLKESILRILERLNPEKIIVISSAPMICYPDCYGIDMARLGEFVAFQAAIRLLKVHGKSHIIDEVYDECKRLLALPKEENYNAVTKIYSEFTQAELEESIAEILTPVGFTPKLEIVYQSVEDLKLACPDHQGAWYFDGRYPTPGGNKVVNKAFVNYYEGNNLRAY